MSSSFSLESPEFNLVETASETRRGKNAPEPDAPFRIAVIGDFSGRENRGLKENGIAERRPVLIDRDNFDEVMAKLSVSVHLGSDGDDKGLTLQFRELDDFHPDRIFERIELFEKLKETRRRLGNPKTFAAAAEEVRKWAGMKEPEREEESMPDESSMSRVDGSSLLDQMLSEAESKPTAAPARATASPVHHDAALNKFLHQIVEPHLAPEEDPQQDELIGVIDNATGELMRAVLHHPDFQALEAAWRAVFFLVSRLETGIELKVYLLDISKEELAADLTATQDLRATGLYKLIVDQSVGTPGADAWSVLAGNYTFDYTPDEVALLGRIGIIAREAGAPFISAAHEHFPGADSLVDTPDPNDWSLKVDADSRAEWSALRQSPIAHYLGLALPRFLLRLPYGEKTEAMEQFDFEEMTETNEHETYLWGNPSFACAYLLGEAFSRENWNFRPGDVQEIENLPLHLYHAGGESQIKPCAEVLLTERAAESILEKGLMPLLSYREQDTIRLARFQSIAEPLANLSGPWK